MLPRCLVIIITGGVPPGRHGVRRRSGRRPCDVVQLTDNVIAIAIAVRCEDGRRSAGAGSVRIVLHLPLQLHARRTIQR